MESLVGVGVEVDVKVDTENRRSPTLLLNHSRRKTSSPFHGTPDIADSIFVSG